MNSKFKILSMFIILCNHLSPDTAHTHDVYYLFCAEKATLSLLISIYLSVYGLFTPVCCVVWKVIYKRGRAVSTSTIHRTTVVLYTCIALGNCWHSPPQSMWQWPGRLATAAVDQLHETCYDWLRGIFGLVGRGTVFLPYRLPESNTTKIYTLCN